MCYLATIYVQYVHVILFQIRASNFDIIVMIDDVTTAVSLSCPREHRHSQCSLYRDRCRIVISVSRLVTYRKVMYRSGRSRL